MADGTTATVTGKKYPTLELDVTTVAGRSTTIGMPIYLKELDTVNQVCVSETTGGTLTLPASPGFSLTVAPGSATFPGGSRSGCISATPVNMDKVPMAPGFGQQPRFIVTIQPVGTTFNPPAAITIPNVDGLPPRAVTEMYSYDHDLASFVAIGTGTVSNDGSVIRSDPGVGVLKAGWHCCGNSNSTGAGGTCPECNSPGGAGGNCNGSCQPDDSRSCTLQNKCMLNPHCSNGSCTGTPFQPGPPQVVNTSLQLQVPQPILWASNQVLKQLTNIGLPEVAINVADIQANGGTYQDCCDPESGVQPAGHVTGSGAASVSLSIQKVPIVGTPSFKITDGLKLITVELSVGIYAAGTGAGSVTVGLRQDACDSTDNCMWGDYISNAELDPNANVTGQACAGTGLRKSCVGVSGQGTLRVPLQFNLWYNAMSCGSNLGGSGGIGPVAFNLEGNFEFPLFGNVNSWQVVIPLSGSIIIGFN